MEMHIPHTVFDEEVAVSLLNRKFRQNLPNVMETGCQALTRNIYSTTFNKNYQLVNKCVSTLKTVYCNVLYALIF